MALRSLQTHWFETFVPRDQTIYALETLAATGKTELELDPRLTVPLRLDQVTENIREFETLARKYAADLPTREFCPTGLLGSPDETASRALRHLRVWIAQLERLRARLTALREENSALLLLQECISALHSDAEAVPRLTHPTPFLYKGLYACPLGHDLEQAVGVAVERVYPGPAHNFLVIAGLPAQQKQIDQLIDKGICRPVIAPLWLPVTSTEQATALAVHLRESERGVSEVERQLEDHRQDADMIEAMANISMLQWYVSHAPALATEQRMCHITGWTTEPDLDRLQAALSSAGIQAVIRFAAAPSTTEAPVHIDLPWWAQPFRFFVEWWGVPGHAEIDPSALLAFVIPLLFGYMFPDVGHGVVLILLSMLLYRRWPEGRFLLPCGVSAVGFGVVFGEVFGFEDIIPALWWRPLDQPLQIMLVPLVFGVALMLLGLVFNAIEAYWRGEWRDWWLADAAVLALYGGALAMVFYPGAAVVVLLALVWYLFGALLRAREPEHVPFARSLGELVHSLFALLINTLSFLRVGAFSLAHVAMSSAILELLKGVENRVAFFFLLAISHVLAIAIEGLVVFVQTTRLVLFEFFIRFLRAEGRVFRSLPPPSPRATSVGQ